MKTPAHSAVYLDKLARTIRALDRGEVDRAIEVIEATWLAGGQVIVFGNGGSALTASHFVTDWCKSAFLRKGRPLRAICLSDNIGLLTACANDISYERVFLEQLKWHLQPGDLVVAVSGSGNSANIVAAVAYANEQGAQTLGLSGFDGGKLRTIVRHSVHVPIHDMQVVEDLHLSFGHMVMQHLCG